MIAGNLRRQSSVIRAHASPRSAFESLAGLETSTELSLDRASAEQFALLIGSGIQDVERGVAPPLWLAARALPLVALELASQVPAGLRADGVVLQHAAQEITVGEPAPLEATLQLDARVTEVGDYGTRHGLRFAAELRNGSRGGSIATLLSTIVGGAAHGRGRLVERPVQLRPGEQLGEETSDITPDLPRRYAEVSGDFNPIHLDAVAARAADLPGVIVHGMATLALAVGAAGRGCPELAGRSLQRLRARMSRPLPAGGPLNTAVFGTSAPRGFRLRVSRGGTEILRDVELWLA